MSPQRVQYNTSTSFECMQDPDWVVNVRKFVKTPRRVNDIITSILYYIKRDFDNVVRSVASAACWLWLQFIVFTSSAFDTLAYINVVLVAPGFDLSHLSHSHKKQESLQLNPSISCCACEDRVTNQSFG